MTGNEIEAEEILTKTFVQSFGQHEKPCAFEIDSALISELKGRFDLSEEPLAPVSPGVKLGGRNVLRPDLEAAIESLPARERLVFLLKDVEAYSTETISALLGLTCAEIQRALLSAHLRLCRRLAASDASSEAA
jgi:RNA polymerase sigma-70 factor (ECF subfamily)